MTETETVNAEYENRLLSLEDFHNREMLTDEQYKALLQRNAQDHAAKIKEINADIAEDAVRNIQHQLGAYETLANDVGTVLDSVFGESKLVAVAQAIINTAQAITRNLAEYPGPLGFAMAAAAAAAGAAQIATITRTTKSNKGGGSRPSVSGSTASSAAASTSGGGSSTGNGQTMYLSIEGEKFGREQVRALADQLIEYQRDGGTVVLKKD